MTNYELDGDKVKIVKTLQTKKYEYGSKYTYSDIIDKEGHWKQIEFLTGNNKGNRKPTPLEKLKEID